ncbi:MAG: hypothetical protein ACOYVF_03155 [Candidatus Zixiibacteriota bacterium]
MLYLKLLFTATALWFFLALFSGCGGDSGGNSADVESIQKADREAIEAMLDEMMWRFKYRDKAALYENELEFLRAEYTFDEYRKHNTIRWAQADSVYSFKILDISFFDRDSAKVHDEVVLKGAGKDSVVYSNEYMVYYNQGRWVKPTLGSYAGQIEYEKEKADSEQ